MKPRLILAVIAGGFVGDLIFVITGAGLVATPSPGSIFAYVIETPRGGWYGVYLGVILAAATSFAVASMLLGFGRFEKEEEVSPDGSTEVVTDGPSEPVTSGATAPAQATTAGAPAPITSQPTTASDM
jgi:PTS system mannitol-specific IIC component